MIDAHAVVATEPARVEYRSVRVPKPGPDEVVVRIQNSWISNGNEGSFVRGERIAGDTPRRDTDPLPFPHVPGYQKVGVVEWAGSQVGNVQVGDVVFATVSRVSTDMFYPSGGHVSPAVTHHTQVWKLPPGLDPAAASGLVLTQVGYNVGMRPALQPGQAAVVIGDGLVGHWAAQTLQQHGARVLMLGRHDDRLARFTTATEADRVVNVSREQDLLAAVVQQWAAGDGVQVVADTVGSIPAVESLLPVMRREGHIASAGFYGRNGLIDIQKLREREITLHAPAGWTKERMDATLDWVARGALQTLPLLTHRFPVARASAVYDLILARNEPVLGVLLDWS